MIVYEVGVAYESFCLRRVNKCGHWLVVIAMCHSFNLISRHVRCWCNVRTKLNLPVPVSEAVYERYFDMNATDVFERL